jgi:hypothetical protein
MQRAFIFAHRVVVLSRLRLESTRYHQQLLQKQAAFALVQPRVTRIQSQHRSFHATSPVHAKNLNFNLADIGEGIAEVPARYPS